MARTDSTQDLARNPGLSRLIHPIDIETFQQEYWQKSHLLVERGDEEYFGNILSLKDIDYYLSSSVGHLEKVRVVRDGKETPVAELGVGSSQSAIENIFANYRAGATLILNAVQARFPALNGLIQQLSKELSSRIQVNTYLTPAGSQGFKAHHDQHDVFIAQLHGTKRWQIFGAPLPLPLRAQSYDHSQAEPAEPVAEFDLKAGDVLYLPRGTVHAGKSADDTSLHMTIGVHPVVWAAVISDAINDLFKQDVRFREALPIGFPRDPKIQQSVAGRLSELLAELPKCIDSQDVTSRVVKSSVSAQAPSLHGHLIDLEKLSEIGQDTKVQRRFGLQQNLQMDTDRVVLHFHGKAAIFPSHVADEVEYATSESTGIFTPRSIPGDLDAAGRITLVRTLVKEGLLEIH
ncbi:cupin domain-containing protein [Kitasatospora purpeofusca]|uniref:cupin domain-containing protein n=1 Tax=Kitasatospora purpeofusca TaxID=67352 RepID=UPI00386DA03C